MAHRYLQFKPDTDVAMLNTVMNVIVTEKLVDSDFIASQGAPCSCRFATTNRQSTS
jgi:anaerobic selenocysteine-containing dehydrogenase